MWEISNSEEVKDIQFLDTYFEEMKAFINTMYNCYDSIKNLNWVQANNMKNPT